MERREFLKGVGTCGLCSCAGMTILGQGKAFASSENAGADEQNWKLAFVQRRVAQLVEIMGSDLEDDTRDKLLESLGRRCAEENKELFTKYNNDPQGFLGSLQEKWAERTEYDEKAGVAKIVGKKADACFCPMVESGETPVAFCNCSLGWQKEAFESITGKTAVVKVEESVLRGGERCSFTITLT